MAEKISGFEDANLCRKCRLSVEHFVSSRKTTTEKAKCGVFVFLSGNIYRFSEGGGRGNGRFPILVPDIWDGFGVTSVPKVSPCSSSVKGTLMVWGEGAEIGVESCKAEL